MSKKVEGEKPEEKKDGAKAAAPVQKKNLDDCTYNEIQDICKELNISHKGKADYLKTLIRVEWINLKIEELPVAPKQTFKNLDEENEDTVFKIASALEMNTTGKKLERVKREIRVYWANKAFVELPCMGLKVKKKIENIRKIEKFTFTHEFSDEEINRKAMQLANAAGDKAGLEEDKKSVMAGFADKIQQKQSEINILSRNIREGFEMVTKDCDVVFDFETFERVYYDCETVVGRVKFTASDHQTALDLQVEKTEESK